ncbi:MAG: glycerophosphodiester phosphodiesterase family protein [bacterium]
MGHRGSPHHFQENTLDGFQHALALGADGVELDVFLTLDHQVVCFHDEETERLTGVKGKITEMTWALVSQLRIQRHLDPGDGTVRDFGTWRPIPRLEEVLEALPATAIVNVELKPSQPRWGERHVGAEVGRLIQHKSASQRAFVTGFDFFKLRALEQETPGIHVGFAYDDDFADYLPAWLDQMPELRPTFGTNRVSWINALAEADKVGRFIGASVVGLERSLVDDDTVAKLHAHRRAVGVYTLFPLDQRNVKGTVMPPPVQDAEARRLQAMGVDWCETDDPERLLRVFDA